MKKLLEWLINVKILSLFFLGWKTKFYVKPILSKEQIKIRRIELNNKKSIDKLDVVAEDKAVCIFINGEYFRTLVATPHLIKELVLGHLIGEGITNSLNEVENIEESQFKIYVDLKKIVNLELINMNKVNLITTACGAPSIFSRIEQLEPLNVESNILVEPENIWKMIRKLHERSLLFKETGGTHSAMLFTLEGTPILFAEDVGRHNAIDKIIGAGVIKGLDFKRCVLVSSGRQSSEMVLKISRVGIPIIASVAGPLSSGINIASKLGITLICFVRGRRMNVYTNKERVKAYSK